MEKDFLIVPDNPTLLELIVAGNYGWKNYSIQDEAFHLNPEMVGKWEYKLISMPEKMKISPAEALNFCMQDGFSPAMQEHILAYVAKFPEEYKKYPIVALGSICLNSYNHSVIAVAERDNKKALFFYCHYGLWSTNSMLLAVKKIED